MKISIFILILKGHWSKDSFAEFTSGDCGVGGGLQMES